jgi:hypothetical protein
MADEKLRVAADNLIDAFETFIDALVGESDTHLNRYLVSVSGTAMAWGTTVHARDFEHAHELTREAYPLSERHEHKQCVITITQNEVGEEKSVTRRYQGQFVDGKPMAVKELPR